MNNNIKRKYFILFEFLVISIMLFTILVSAVEMNDKQEKYSTEGNNSCCGIDTKEDAPPKNNQNSSSVRSAVSAIMTSPSGNVKTFRTDTAPELDWYQPCNGGDNLINFNINVNNIELSAIKSAKLTLAVWDVDFDCGMPGECERDTVYVNGHRLTTPEPFLTGANGQWSTVTFNVEPGWIIEGENYVEIDIDTLTRSYWCVEADWGELALEMKDIDLKVESKDILISPTQWWQFWEYPFDISVDVHNNGIEKAENVEVKIVKKFQNVEIESEIKTISEVQPGGSSTTSVNWNLDFDQDIEVIVDPSDKLDESNEDNNKALTTKTSGTIQNSNGQPMVHLPVTYQEKVGTDWVDTKITVYTDGVGRYYIINNLNAITSGREGRTKADLMYSPTHDAGTTVFRIIDETEWGNGVTPSSRRPVSKHPNWWTMDKSTDYTSDMTFTDNEGGIAYVTLVTAYNYHKNRGTAPSDETLIEINDNDLGGAQARPWLHTINLPSGLRGTSRPSAIGHEYTHVVELGWSVAGTGGSHNPLTPVEEASSHWGSSEARNSQIYQYPDGNNGYINIDISDNAQTNGGPPTPENFLGAREEFQMAGTMWDLAEDLGRENEVWSTLRFGGFWWWQDPDTPRNFYTYYLDRDSNPSPTIKNVFRAHGYNTTGWPGKNGNDPNYFTGNYKDFKIDKNSDGIAEYLNINVELDIPTPGYYILSGGIQGLELGASNYSYLDSGIQNVSLKFYGEALFESGLNGPYNLSVFLGDGTYEILDYRIGSYLTSVYSFTEFARPIMLFTGNYNDYGIDSDSNGLYDNLTMDVEVNVTIPGNYEVYGNLYAGDTFIDYAKNYTYLNEGISIIKLNFDGVTIHANGINGPYKLKDLTIPGSYPVYTSAYSYSEFQSPGANLGSIISVSGIDIDADGLYNQLAVTVNTDCFLPGNYTISGYLYDSSGRHIISGYKNTNLFSGSQNIQLDFDGTIIRNEGKNGPYNLTIELFDRNGVFIAKKTGVTSYFAFTQFQISPQGYFNTTYTDQGIDVDNNGLKDYLNVEVNISSIIKTGNYRLDGYLYNENGSAAFASATSYIDTQTRIVKLNFSGQDIWRSKIFNDTFNLDLRIYDNNSTLVVNLQKVHKTSKYLYTDFQPPKAFFKDIYSDHGEDINDDGINEYLSIEVGLNVTTAGNYSIFGSLNDMNGFKIAENNNQTYLNTGNQKITLNFDGYSIYKHQVNGSYNLTNLLLYDGNGTLSDNRYIAYITSAYNYTNFQRPSVRLTGNYSDYGTDTNVNGLYEKLTVNAEVFVENAGTYAINARIMDQNENEIVWAANTISLSAGKFQIMKLDFDGETIGKHGVNGPYYLRDVYIYNVADTTKSDYVYDAYKTGAYNNTDFEGFLMAVTSPNGGEDWKKGSTQNIRWRYTGNPGPNVKIDLLKGGVLNYTINASVPIGSGGSGSYNWLINPIQASGNDYKIKITSTTNPAYIDTSDNYFNISPQTGGNLIINPGFENGTANWTFYTNGTGNFTIVSPGYEGAKAAKLNLISNGTNIQLYQKNVTLEPKGIYRLSFAAYSTTGHDVKITLFQHGSPFTDYGLVETFDLGTNWQTFTTEFTAANLTATVNDGRLMFYLAPFVEAGDIYYIDDVRLEKIGIDNTPPTVTGNTPTGNNVLADTPITVTFSEKMNQIATQLAFSTSPASNGSFYWEGTKMTYIPYPNLAYDTLYTVTVGTAAKDSAGNNLQSVYSWVFRTVLPKPIINCTTISSPGVYALNVDIMNHPGTCIYITSSNVIFDGTGHKIDGINAAGAYGVNVHNTTAIITNITVTNLLVTDWDIGIFLNNSNSNNVTGNNISTSNTAGIKVSSSGNNNIFNNYFDNNRNFVFDGIVYQNTWNTTQRQGKNIIGGSYLGGNFWANSSGSDFSQTCPDSNNDGLCDLRYSLNSNNIDFLPLTPKHVEKWISVVIPNGGENWTRGTTRIINWTSKINTGPYVRIELLKAGILNRVIVASTLNDGTHPWTILATQTPGTDYKVRITSTSNASYTDTSDNNFTIPTPNITVITPNGGETWRRGTTQTIKWNSSGSPGTYVKIELLKGGFLNRVIVASTPNDGTHPWPILSAQASGTDYKVRITSTTNPAYNDTSDNSFTILTPSITVVTPNGGENWTRGTTKIINWSSNESPGTYVKIELLKAGVLNRVIVESTLNDGSHPWLIPGTQIPGADYKVRITSNANISNKDTSDNNFTIPAPSITVVSPNGGENWRRGTTQTIKWNSTESPGTYVKIELLKPGVANKVIIASTLNDGSHPWIIPATQLPGDDYRVKITSTINASVNDTSDNPFTIPAPSFTVVSPNGGENWTRGTTQTIKWNSTESPGTYVKIELLKPGMANKAIILSTLNDGSHPWPILATQGTGDNYRIKITSTINASVNDTSDNNFSIVPPKITVTSPNGGQTWIRGTNHLITWNYTGNPGTYVKIELLKGGVLNKIILSSTLNDKSQGWTIPSTQIPGADYKIRITSTTNLAYNDTSDSNFTIAVPII